MINLKNALSVLNSINIIANFSLQNSSYEISFSEIFSNDKKTEFYNNLVYDLNPSFKVELY